MYLILQHAVLFFSTCMTSYMQFKEKGGWSFKTGILVKGWIALAVERKIKKREMLK